MGSTTDNVQIEILKILEAKHCVNTLDLSKELSLNHNIVVGHIKSLDAVGDLIETESSSFSSWELTEEGEFVVTNGSYEAIVYNHISSNGEMEPPEISNLFPMAKIGLSKALANGWVKIDKSTRKVNRNVDTIIDLIQEDLTLIKGNKFDDVPSQRKQEYKKRKLIKDTVIVTFNVRKGESFSTTLSKFETDLTADMVADESWKSLSFKPYNFDALGVQPSRGHLHPLMKVRAEFREIFLEMGFSEMPTNKFVESSFWNFDALFQPQQHPARDAHDTFFLTSPKNCKNIPPDYMERVSKMHSHGGSGSLGYNYQWSIDEAKKNLLRTHTTAVSARMLFNLSQQKEFQPVKFFSIDRVFRNETLDATHLAEFHQVEGVIADFNLTLGDLIGVLYEFFSKLGIKKLKFKPAYNPYTEPSMEIFCFHPGLNKWIEVGNSGMFRPEMLSPMGLPQNVNVIAWGLSLERPTMIKYSINNIRDLVGPRVKLQVVSENPICRIQK